MCRFLNASQHIQQQLPSRRHHAVWITKAKRARAAWLLRSDKRRAHEAVEQLRHNGARAAWISPFANLR
jgi:hypothetical protein